MPPFEFSLIAQPGFAGLIGGSGRVIGTGSAETITLAGIGGEIAFDPSFNRGGDRIVFPDAAADYAVSLEQSSARIESGESSYLVPIGNVGAWLGFADGWRLLRFDTESRQAMLGSQVVDATPAAIMSPPADPGDAPSTDEDATALLLLGEAAETTAAGNFRVIGTNASERLTYEGGNFVLDPSFNGGEDFLFVPETPSAYSVWLDQSSAVLASEAGSITLPVGPNAMTIDFSGAPLELGYSQFADAVLIGERAITGSAPHSAIPVQFSAVHTFGDSLVDAGNALGLAEWFDGLPLQDLPEGAPVEEDGYFLGRFSDGYIFADLLTNRFTGEPGEPVFPYGFDDPFLGIPISPFASEPDEPNLNWAYGGAQIIQGSEVVLDLDDQTDAFRDAVDGEADPSALYIFTFGGNDVRDLVPSTGDPESEEDAFNELDDAAEELLEELAQMFDIGARHFLVTGIPDVGIVPQYDINGNGVFDSAAEGIGEAGRIAVASMYSAYLDDLVREDVVTALEAMGAQVTYVPIADVTDGEGTVITPGALTVAIPTLAPLNGLGEEELASDLLGNRDVVFFDDIHPTGQLHALVGAQLLAQVNGVPHVEILPLDGEDVDFSSAGSIASPGEQDTVAVMLTAGVAYTVQMLGIASLGTNGALADPQITVLDPEGEKFSALIPGTGNDAGPGLDASIAFVAPETGEYTFVLSAGGAVTGDYLFQLGSNAASELDPLALAASA